MPRSTPRSDDTAVLLETLAQLFPDAPSVQFAHRRFSATSAASQWIAMPNARSPRLLVPAGNRRGAAGALCRFSAALSRSEVAQRMAVALFVHAGGSCAFADRLLVEHAGEDSIASYLAEFFGQEVCFSVGVGTKRVNRKPILQVFDRKGRCLAFVKVGASPAATGDVRGEARALRELASVQWRTIEIPAVLHEGPWRDLHLLLLTPLETRARRIRQTGPPLAQMAELTSAFSDGASALAETGWWRRTTEPVDGASQELTYRLAAALSRLAERHGGEVWPIGAWHGDWTPWNMAWRNEVAQVWDWERFETGVPAGIDAMHYVVNKDTVRYGTSAAVIERALANFDELADPRASRVRAAAYLSTIARRYLAATQRPDGHLIEVRAKATIEALESRLR